MTIRNNTDILKNNIPEIISAQNMDNKKNKLNFST